MSEVLKVFISATSADLGEVRRAARAALEANPYFKPIEQAHFGPAAETLGAGDRRRLAECDAVLHIVGECYGHEPPPSAKPRRSYTQLEHDDARALKKPLYLFVCADGFPYTTHDPEPADKRALQDAHRSTLLNGHDEYDLIADLPAFKEKIREIDLPLQRLLEGKALDLQRKARIHRLSVAAAVLVVCVLLLAGAYVVQQSARTPEAARQGAKEGVLAAGSFDRERIRANLTAKLKNDAAARIAQLDRALDWEKIATLEKERDRQLADVDRFLEGMDQAFEKKEVSANYAAASRLLAERGPAEALRFLEAKSGEREKKLEVLQFAKDRTEEAIRKLLREKLLAASLLERGSRWDKAEAEYRSIIREGGTWPEPRNQLADFLVQRAISVGPAAGILKLREAAELCRGTLDANPRESDPQSWADTQNSLGNALSIHGELVEGAESVRLFREAVMAYRASLEVRRLRGKAWHLKVTQIFLADALLALASRSIEETEAERFTAEAEEIWREVKNP